MIRSPHAWKSDDPAGWLAAEREYVQYLRSARRRFPPVLVDLVDSFTFHDDRFVSGQILSRLPSGRDALVSLKTFRDEHAGAESLVVLHLVGVKKRFTVPPTGSDILYFDAEVIEPSLFRLTFVVDDRPSWSVVFSDIFFLQHTYSNKTKKERQPNKALQTTSVTRSGFGKVPASDRQRRGV